MADHAKRPWDDDPADKHLPIREPGILATDKERFHKPVLTRKRLMDPRILAAHFPLPKLYTNNNGKGLKNQPDNVAGFATDSPPFSLSILKEKATKQQVDHRLHELFASQ